MFFYIKKNITDETKIYRLDFVVNVGRIPNLIYRKILVLFTRLSLLENVLEVY